MADTDPLLPKSKPNCGTRPVLTLIGGILVHLTLGSYFTFENIVDNEEIAWNIETYIISYLKFMSGEPNLRNVDSLWITNIRTIPSIIALVLGGMCEKRFGYKTAIIAGCVVFTAAVGLTFLAIKESLLLVTLTYGLVAGIGSNFAYGIPIQASVKWFPNRPGLAIGVIMCGFGGGTLIFNQVITAYINPDNVSPDFVDKDGERYFTDKELLRRVPYVFLIMAAMKFGMQVAGIPLITVPKEETNFKPKISSKTNGSSHVQNADAKYCEIKKVTEEENCLKSERPEPKLSVTKILKRTLKTGNSYVIFTFVFMMFAAMQYPITLYKAYGQTFIHDDNFLALVGSLSAIFNCLFRPFWGIAFDKLGFKVTSKLLSAIFVCILCSLTQTEKLIKPAFLIWICASYGAFCGTYPVAASQITKLFGSSNMVIDLSLLSVAIAVATLFGGLTGIAVKDTIGWNGLFLLSGFLAATGFFSTFLYKDKPVKCDTPERTD